jgi:hypothetical protein
MAHLLSSGGPAASQHGQKQKSGVEVALGCQSHPKRDDKCLELLKIWPYVVRQPAASALAFPVVEDS